MRIVGGTHKGRPLKAPKDARVRPTSDRTREAIFNVLAHGDFGDWTLEGARVLDLFAGTGALGLEALSRGASFALFVDDHPQSRGLIRENAEPLGETGRIKLYRRDATKLSGREGSAGPPFTLVFCDPPYGKGLGGAALDSAHAGGWLDDTTLCVLEESASADVPCPDGFEELDRRAYGDTQVIFLAPSS
ncbi:MAG: 16S rRNA (guanine(966)-N(2))-methyltransferase RsmD [Candidatus Phaeomarinobacter sp.]